MTELYNLDTHRLRREIAYRKVQNFWPDLYQNEYALYDVVLLTEKEIEEIYTASNRIGQIFFKTAELLRNSPDEILLQLDVPKELLPFIRHRALPSESVISRLDLVQTADGLKLLEINSDTPTFEKEVFYANGFICKEFSIEDPNEGAYEVLGKELRRAIGELLHRNHIKNEPHIVFTSHNEHIEDKYTTLFLMEAAKVPAKYVPLHQLTIQPSVGLFDDEGKKIDILYRQTYPLEHLIYDKDAESHEQIGIQLLELVMENQLHLLNPISAFLIQSKAVQAVIWGMMERNHSYFTDQEKTWISQYFLPTYLENDRFLERGEKYVKKPSFGREGDTVSVYDRGKKIFEDIHKTYKSSLPVYQKYIELPTKQIKTIEGTKTGNILIGSFLLNGKAKGIGIRAGKQITDNNAYFLPVGLKR